jgi:hypothetical protein
MDLFARSKWFEYSRARDEMFARTGAPVPWHVIPSDDKKTARLNALTHILSSIDYEHVLPDPVTLPSRPADPAYVEPPLEPAMVRSVPLVYTAELLETAADGTRWTDIAKAFVSEPQTGPLSRVLDGSIKA